MKKVTTSITRKIISLFLVMALTTTPLYAENAQKDSSEADFTIEAIENKEQLNKEVSYFHLPIDKNYSDNPLQIEVRNNGDIDQEFKISFYMAKTNTNGLITYGEKAYGPNTSLVYNIEDFVKINRPVRIIKAHSSEVVDIQLDTSKIEKVNGILMGAFKVEKTNTKEIANGIGSIFTYQLGLILTDDESGELIPSTEIDYSGYELNVEVGRKVLRYYIDNYEPNMTEKIKVVASLVSKKNDKIVLEKTMPDVVIAPNGTFSNYLDWNKYDVKPGEYVLEINAEGTASEYSWEDSVIITEDKAKEMNEESLNKIVILKEHIFISLIMLVVTIVNHVLLLKRKGE